MKRTLLIFFAIACFLVPTVSSAEKNILFDRKGASEFIQSLDNYLKTSDVHLSELVLLVKRLEEYQKDAEICVKNAGKELSKINILLKGGEHLPEIMLSKKDLGFLMSRKEAFSRALSECQLFIYESEEKESTYKSTIQSINLSKIFMQTSPIWRLDTQTAWQSLSHFDINNIPAIGEFNQLTPSYLLLLLIVIALSLLIGYLTLIALRHFQRSETYMNHPNIQALTNTLVYLCIPILCMGSITAFFSVIYYNIAGDTNIEQICDTLFIFVFIYGLFTFLLKPPKLTQSPIPIRTELSHILYQRVIITFSIITIGYVGAIVFRNQPFSPDLFSIFRTLSIITASLLLLWSLLPLFELEKLQPLSPKSKAALKCTLVAIFATLIFLECAGFYDWAIFLVSGLFFSIILFILLFGGIHFIEACYKSIHESRSPMTLKIKSLLGVNRNKTIFEFFALRFVAYAFLLFYISIGFMQAWGTPPPFIDGFKEWFYTGIKVQESSISAAHMLHALLTFCGLLILSRIISTKTAYQMQTDHKIENQVAFASLLFYIGFSFSFLIALFVLGVNFTGLAIIAGALSVGIGLGLQNIANDFVSGIIILLEKQLKPGDRIIVGNIEGFIKKIRIRSTQITTIAKEDVIVPNSELTANQITNFMYKDNLWRCVCKTGVAYGSDIDLVKKVLLEVASDHDEVIKEGINEPIVFFKEFGDSSLNFELWCVITNVNRKYFVISDLHFKINKAFEKHNITIAFPQRDVHMK